MKTIFITISRGSIVKNILRNNFFEILRGRNDLKIVILSPAFNDDGFKKEFGGENISFEPLFEHKWNWRDYFFVGINKSLVYNESTILRDKFGILSINETSAIRRFLRKFFFRPLSKIGFVKEMVRFFDALFCPGKKYYELFARYRPSLIFSTNPIEDADSYVLKTAKKFKVKSVAMPKSWDNIPKMSFRVKPDAIFIWGGALIDQAIKFQNIRRENIFVVGVPQFDICARSDVLSSRDIFFDKVGAKKEKALLVFGSNSKYTPFDGEIVEMILDWIKKGELMKDCVLFVRPYFAAKNEEDKFKNFLNQENVVIDRWFNRNNLFRDSWDYSQEHLVHFASLIKHCSVMINYPSTLTLDAVAFDKPIISLAFDGKEKHPYGESVARWYDSAHFKQIKACNGTTIVYSPEELKKAINNYLENPEINKSGRELLRDKFCYKIDGKSGDRLADAIIEKIGL